MLQHDITSELQSIELDRVAYKVLLSDSRVTVDYFYPGVMLVGLLYIERKRYENNSL